MIHTLYGPSSLSRRALCPGSARMEKDLPEVSSAEADEGTNLHKLVADMLKGHAINLEAEGFHEADAIVGRFNDLRLHNYTLLIEETLPCDFIRPGEVGTLDLGSVIPYGEAFIVDLKFGYTPVADAKDNLQLGAYAVAIYDKYECSSVTVALWQPRLNKYTEHIYNSELLKKVRDLIALRIVADCEKPDAPLIPTSEGCRFCKAKATCPALQNQIIMPDTTALTPVKRAELLDRCELALMAIGAFKAECYALLAAGGQIPGWHLVEGNQRREFKSDAASEVKSLLADLGKDPSLAFELISPAQVEKITGKSKAVRERLAALIETKPGNPKLERI